ncbi:hypothetical protein ACLQ24_03725 [Micromonospora sp. DT4]|uniref:hypothetical protein n=1 Tax=Micromonospora sp. DT4 TaxID=3393438 RepID=UPI003CEE5AB0
MTIGRSVARVRSASAEGPAAAMVGTATAAASSTPATPRVERIDQVQRFAGRR